MKAEIRLLLDTPNGLTNEEEKRFVNEFTDNGKSVEWDHNCLPRKSDWINTEFLFTIMPSLKGQYTEDAGWEVHSFEWTSNDGTVYPIIWLCPIDGALSKDNK